MPERIVAILTLVLFAGCRADPPARAVDADLPRAAELVISPDPAASAVGPATAEAELRQRFGADRLRREPVYIGEGETEPGTVLFPDDPTRMAELLWFDPDTRTRPHRLMIRGGESHWSMPPGIALGISLDSLERLNDGPFLLAGFGWDYEGTVMDWNGGALDALHTADARALIRLAIPQDATISEADVTAVGGEGPFPSDHPAMRRLNPRVREMGIIFRDPTEDADPGTVVRRSVTGQRPTSVAAAGRGGDG